MKGTPERRLHAQRFSGTLSEKFEKKKKTGEKCQKSSVKKFQIKIFIE